MPQSRWLLTSLAYLGAHKFGIGALDYITYPVQVVVKCCKPIPVRCVQTCMHVIMVIMVNVGLVVGLQHECLWFGSTIACNG